MQLCSFAAPSRTELDVLPYISKNFLPDKATWFLLSNFHSREVILLYFSPVLNTFELKLWLKRRVEVNVDHCIKNADPGDESSDPRFPTPAPSSDCTW